MNRKVCEPKVEAKVAEVTMYQYERDEQIHRDLTQTKQLRTEVSAASESVARHYEAMKNEVEEMRRFQIILDS